MEQEIAASFGDEEAGVNERIRAGVGERFEVELRHRVPPLHPSSTLSREAADACDELVQQDAVRAFDELFGYGSVHSPGK